MWSVNIKGTWCTAQSERQIINWLRQGHVELQTLVHRPHWPAPVPLRDAPELSALLAQDERSRQHNSRIAQIVLWAVAELVALVVLCGIAVSGMTASIAISAILFAVVSLATIPPSAPIIPRAVRYSASLLRGHRLFMASWITVLMIAAGAGWAVHFYRREACLGVVAEVSGLKTRRWPSDSTAIFRQFDILSGEFKRGRATCDKLGMARESDLLRAAEAALADARINASKMVETERQRLLLAAEEEQNRKSKEAGAQKSREAVAQFPLLAREIEDALAKASGNAAAGRWLDVDANLIDAYVVLNGLLGTTVESDARYLALSSRVATLRKKFAHQIDQVHAQSERASRAAQARAEQVEATNTAADAIRGKKPRQDFDGCCYECKQYLKQVMNDPDSYECVAATLPQIEGNFWTVVMGYRGKNGFGATTTETKKFFIQGGQVEKTDP